MAMSAEHRSNLQPLTSHDHVSIWVKKSRVVRKTQNKQTNKTKNSAVSIGFVAILFAIYRRHEGNSRHWKHTFWIVCKVRIVHYFVMNNPFLHQKHIWKIYILYWKYCFCNMNTMDSSCWSCWIFWQEVSLHYIHGKTRERGYLNIQTLPVTQSVVVISSIE